MYNIDKALYHSFLHASVASYARVGVQDKSLRRLIEYDDKNTYFETIYARISLFLLVFIH